MQTTTIPTGVRMVEGAPPKEARALSVCAAAALARLCALDWDANKGRGNKHFSKAQVFGGSCGASVSAQAQRNAIAELTQNGLVETNDNGEYRPSMTGHETNSAS